MYITYITHIYIYYTYMILCYVYKYIYTYIYIYLSVCMSIIYRLSIYLYTTHMNFLDVAMSIYTHVMCASIHLYVQERKQSCRLCVQESPFFGMWPLFPNMWMLILRNHGEINKPAGEIRILTPPKVMCFLCFFLWVAPSCR